MSTEQDLEIAELALERGSLVELRREGIEREADRVAEALARLATQDAPKPPRSLRKRVLGAIRPATALDGFALRAAQLLDWPLARARALLREATGPVGPGWVDGPTPGIRIRPLEAGPRRGPAVAGLIWCAPGSVFPEHRHRGAEWALVLAGHARNSGGDLWSVGDWAHQPAGSTHSFAVSRDGVPLIAAVVVREGFELV